MTLRTEEDTLIWRKLWIAICGGIVLEEALNQSSDRLLDDDMLRRSDNGYNPHRQASGIINETFPAGFPPIPTWSSVHTQSP